jgi:tripartite-type tricarboxylate transporter receptor subunit TctC
MVAHPSVGAKTLKEFIAVAKTKPGQLNYASSGPGTPYHMAGELFKAMSGTEIVHVSHKTSGDMRSSVIGGHVQMMFDAITVMAQGVRSGQLIGLGTTGAKRSAVMPEMPTIAEAGVPGYEMSPWIGVFVPTGTSKELIAKLNSEINRALKAPDVSNLLSSNALDALGGTPEEFDVRIKADYEKYAKLIKLTGAKVD